jgi:hypothetical protein
MDSDDLKYLIKVNIRDVFYGYFEPLKMVIPFLAIPTEMMRQAFISLSMDSESFEKLQELKFQEDVEELVALGLQEEEVLVALGLQEDVEE